jgi:large subunit ribosomal protein L20
MARVKRGVTAKARHRKILGQAKGYYNARRKVFRAAKQAVIKAGQYAAARANGLSYSRLMNGLSLAQIEVDRKVLADIAVHDSEGFAALAAAAKEALAA